MWAEKSTENPMHMMRLIMEMESKLTSHKAMNPTTPNSMEMIEKATQSEQMGLGMRIRDTTIMIPAATLTHWTVVVYTNRNWSKKMKKGWKTVTLNGEAWQTALSSLTKFFSPLES